MACDFQAVQGGKSGLWRYLDDPRDRTWSTMTAGAAGGVTGMVGGGDDGLTAIGSCLDNDSGGGNDHDCNRRAVFAPYCLSERAGNCTRTRAGELPRICL